MMHLQVHLAMYTCNDPPDLLLLIILHLQPLHPHLQPTLGTSTCNALHLITLSPYHLNLVPGAGCAQIMACR